MIRLAWLIISVHFYYLFLIVKLLYQFVTIDIMIIVRDKNLDSISILVISTGIYDFPLTKAVKIICNTIKNFIKANSSMKDKTIVFCNLDDTTVILLNYYLRLMSSLSMYQWYSEKMKGKIVVIKMKR